MRLLQSTTSHAAAVGEATTQAYGELIRDAGGRTLRQGPTVYLAHLQQRYGRIYCAEFAPYGVYGYVLWRTNDAGRTQYLSATSPFHGQQIPLVWADPKAARELAAALGCQCGYASHSDGINAIAYLADAGQARFGNCGAPVEIACAGIAAPASRS